VRTVLVKWGEKSVKKGPLLDHADASVVVDKTTGRMLKSVTAIRADPNSPASMLCAERRVIYKEGRGESIVDRIKKRRSIKVNMKKRLGEDDARQTSTTSAQEVFLAKQLLPVGQWCSVHWLAADLFAGLGLVLWDLDREFLETMNLCAWLDNVSRLVTSEMGCEDCAFVGCLKERAAEAVHLHRHPILHALRQSTALTGGWCGRMSKLVVVPGQQAVEKHLLSEGRAAINGASPPRALVVVTRNGDFLPLLSAAKDRGVRTLLVSCAMRDPRRDTADVSVLVEEATGRVRSSG